MHSAFLTQNPLFLDVQTGSVVVAHDCELTSWLVPEKDGPGVTYIGAEEGVAIEENGAAGRAR